MRQRTKALHEEFDKTKKTVFEVPCTCDGEYDMTQSHVEYEPCKVTHQVCKPSRAQAPIVGETKGGNDHGEYCVEQVTNRGAVKRDC